MVQIMQGRNGCRGQISRRRFLGWGAAALSAAAVPGVLMLGERSAAAAPRGAVASSPYTMASWMGLVDRTAVATSATTQTTLKVVSVTNTATQATGMVAGESFRVDFGVAEPVAAGIYAVSAPGMT